jgi:hypothetical protein
MALEPIDFINGLFSLIFVVISIIVGLRIILNYTEHKRHEFILIGLAWIGVTEPWWPSAISFILVLTTGKGLSFVLYVIIGNVAIPVTFSVWMAAFSEFLFKEKQKLTLILSIIFGIVFEIVFFYLLFTDPTSIGELSGHIDIEYKYWALGLLLLILWLIFIMGLIFSRVSIKSDNPEVKLQGKFLLISFISFGIGAFFDAIHTLNIIGLLIVRILLISSAIEWYFGFLLPNWTKRLFIKEG